MKIINKNTIKIFLAITILLQFKIATSHTMFVVGPSTTDNWYKNLKETYKWLKKRTGKSNIIIFQNMTNKKDINSAYDGDLNLLSENLASEIVTKFVEINKDKKEGEEKEKISLACYGGGAHIIVSAMYKLEEKIKSRPSFKYNLYDIINNEINGYQKPNIPKSSSKLDNIYDAQISSSESSTPSRLDESSDSEQEQEVTVDFSQPMVQQQIINIQQAMSPQQISRMNEFMGNINKTNSDEYHGANSNLKVILKIVTVTGGTISGVCGATVATATAITTVAGLGGIVVVALL